MVRIGIIGSENSHALAFSQLINLSGKYPDLRVVAIYGEDAEASQRIFDECGLDFIATDGRDMLGRIDALMVTSRNGALHAGYARPYIEAGLPMFIDKPIANDGTEAYELLKLAKAKGVPIMGGSSVKFAPDTLALRDAAQKMAAEGKLMGGHVWAPVQMVNPYGDFYFYSSHLIETAMMIYGFSPKAVRAIRTDAGVSAILEYQDFAVQLSYLEQAYHYGGTVLGKDQAVTREISLEGCYDGEVEHFAQLVRTGKMPQPIEALAIPIFALNAIERAYETGLPQEIALPS